MNKLEAVKYLVKHNEHNDEWSGAGMYIIIEEVINDSKEFFTKEELDTLLEKAKNN